IENPESVFSRTVIVEVEGNEADWVYRAGDELWNCLCYIAKHQPRIMQAAAERGRVHTVEARPPDVGEIAIIGGLGHTFSGVKAIGGNSYARFGRNMIGDAFQRDEAVSAGHPKFNDANGGAAQGACEVSRGID